MITINTKELSDAALDYAVALTEGFKKNAAASLVIMNEYSPTTNWEQAGVIIEREQITITPSGERVYAECRGILVNGKTYRIAAMRAYVASKLGKTVEIPDELVD